jgi:hypothetical protein
MIGRMTYSYTTDMSATNLKVGMSPSSAKQWHALRLPEILAIFRLGDKSKEEKCPIWTL